MIVEKDIVYGTGDGKELKLNLARPERAEGLLPGLVYIHGGGWRDGDRKDYNGEIQEAARRGYVAVTITYRLSDPDKSGKPRNPFPAQIEDVKCAVCGCGPMLRNITSTPTASEPPAVRREAI